jgi:hypothetical protein
LLVPSPRAVGSPPGEARSDYATSSFLTSASIRGALRRLSPQHQVDRLVGGVLGRQKNQVGDRLAQGALAQAVPMLERAIGVCETWDLLIIHRTAALALGLAYAFARFLGALPAEASPRPGLG